MCEDTTGASRICASQTFSLVTFCPLRMSTPKAYVLYCFLGDGSNEQGFKAPRCQLRQLRTCEDTTGASRICASQTLSLIFFCPLRMSAHSLPKITKKSILGAMGYCSVDCAAGNRFHL